MNASPGRPALPPPVVPDWGEWRLALGRFSTATGLTVSAYDADLVRRAGPYIASKVGTELAAGGIFDPGRAGHDAESTLARTALESGAPGHLAVYDELHVRALPIAIGGTAVGVATFGWVFNRFGTALDCERLGRSLGVNGARLWAEARLESPVSVARMDVYQDLLQTLIVAATRHEEAIERLAELGRMREVFLAQVSHELRAPLTVLSNRTELLLRSRLDDPDRIRAGLEQIRAHVREEARLVEDLIDTARSRTGQLTIDRQPADLDEILESALQAVVPNAEAKGVRIETPALGASRHRPILADRIRLQQVFWNLLSNAVKFTPAGGRVALEVAESDTLYTVTVTDTGRGIDADMLSRVFDPFTRQRSGNEQGLGLGLSIASVLVEAHGGRIEARSAGLGKGAVLEVVLPVPHASPPRTDS